MFNEEFIRRITTQEYIDAKALLTALEEPSPVSIRINKAKWNRIPEDSEQVSWCRNGYYLRSRPSYTFDPLFHSGCYYPQEASGMFLEQVLLQAKVPLNNMRVLDLCGAPGGKSTLMSDIIGPDSLLVANDVIGSRAVILAETITKWGSCNTMVTRSDPEAFGRLSGFFDIILVDAPCSGEGMFRTGIAVSEWSTGNSTLCAERQKRILMDIWPGLKENGILIYSTCTFNPGENEENIKWLTDKNDAECIRLDLKLFPGITEIDWQGIYGYGFYPDKVRGEGLFISAIRKKSSQKPGKTGNFRLQELKPAKSDLELVAAWTFFDRERILKWGDEIIAVPCDLSEYAFLFKNLKVVKPGTIISKRKQNDHIPSHELALSTKLKQEFISRHEITLDEAISFLRRDRITVGNIQTGWNILTYNDINLGLVKNVGSRVNNYHPVEWRIRMDTPTNKEVNRISWTEKSGHII